MMIILINLIKEMKKSNINLNQDPEKELKAPEENQTLILKIKKNTPTVDTKNLDTKANGPISHPILVQYLVK